MMNSRWICRSVFARVVVALVLVAICVAGPLAAQELEILPGRVAAAELDLDALIAQAPAIGDKPNFTAFPVAKEDFAFVVDAQLPSAELISAIDGSTELLESVRLFDVYTGDQVGAGSKSLALAVRLRAADHTLTDAQIKAAREKIVEAARAVGAELR